MEIRVNPQQQPAPTIQALQRQSDDGYFAAVEADLMPTLVKLRLDQKQTTYVGRKGDLTAWVTYVDLPARKREPALLLACSTDPATRHVYVQLAELWVVLEDKDNRRIIQQMAQRLYGFPTRDDEFRVLDALFDFAEDLKNAKPPVGFDQRAWLQALAEDDMVLIFNDEKRNA